MSFAFLNSTGAGVISFSVVEGHTPWRPWWFIVACAALVVFAVYLFAQGDDSIVARLSLLAQILGILLVVLYAQRELRRRDPGPHEPRRRTFKEVVIVAAAAVLLVTATITGWIIWSTSEVPVTGQIVLSGAEQVADDGTAIVRIPGEPPNRGHIRLTPVITNNDKTGDCVAPATLELTVFVDGQAAGKATARSEDSVDLSIEGASGTVFVEITVRQDDPECVVALGINEAVLHD